jgi:arylsulfatase A-like enzyme
MNKKSSIAAGWSRSVLSGLAAGLAAGIAIGIAETWAAVSRNSWHVSEGSRLLPWALAIDGLMCAAIGGALGLLVAVLHAFRRKSSRITSSSWPMAWGGCTSFFAFLYLVLLLRSREPGILLLLFAAACCMGVVVALMARRLIERPRRFNLPSNSRLGAACLAVVFLLGGLVSMGVRASQARGTRQDETEPSSRMNVVLVLIDTLRADHLGCYGYERIETPVMDRLANEGMAFTRAFSTASWTRPSTASLLTSLYPTEHGAISGRPEDMLPESRLTLAEVLQAEGYSTVGILGNDTIRSSLGFGQGFDTCVDTSDIPRRNAQLNNLILLRALQYTPFRWKFPCDNGIFPRAAEINSALQEILDVGAQQPFFLYLHYVDPHSPYGSPPPFHRMYDPDYQGTTVAMPEKPLWLLREDASHPPYTHVPLTLTKRDLTHLVALYDEDITYMDHHLGQMLKALEGQGLLDNALVIITSDHGEEFLEHGGIEHGETLFDDQVHVPLIFWSRQELPQLVDTNGLVSLVDVMPTILEVLGIAVPEGLSGQSLVSGDQAGSPDEPVHEFIFAEENCPIDRRFVDIMLRTETEKLMLSKVSPFLLDGDWEEIHYYDLVNDPGEQRNLAMMKPGRVAELHEKLASFMDSLQKAETTSAPEMDAATKARLRALGYIRP